MGKTCFYSLVGTWASKFANNSGTFGSTKLVVLIFSPGQSILLSLNASASMCKLIHFFLSTDGRDNERHCHRNNGEFLQNC